MPDSASATEPYSTAPAPPPGRPFGHDYLDVANVGARLVIAPVPNAALVAVRVLTLNVDLMFGVSPNDALSCGRAFEKAGKQARSVLMLATLQAPGTEGAVDLGALRR